MFHIVFNADETYIKYLAVLCYSIIYHSKHQHSKQDGYHFHILTNGLTPETQAKLARFEALLSKSCPCKIDFYVLNDQEFEGFPKLHGSYLTYFRLKMSNFLPKDLTLCLYLDVDMLCLSDIRGIFEIDLGDKICGVVKDAHYKTPRVMNPKNKLDKVLSLEIESYFNAGLMLINLNKWREQNIQDRCFQSLQNYIPEWHDQDILNAVIGKEVALLPLEWNLMEGHFQEESASFRGGESGSYRLSYTEEEYLHARENIKIVHFICLKKPWLDANFASSYYRDWWNFALQTPVFGDELLSLYLQDTDKSLKVLLQKKLAKIKRKFKKSLKKIFQK